MEDMDEYHRCLDVIAATNHIQDGPEPLYPWPTRNDEPEAQEPQVSEAANREIESLVEAGALAGVIQPS